MSLEAPLQVVCQEYRVRLRTGSLSQPLVVVAAGDSGGMTEFVLKVRNPDRGTHFGPTSLACELVCSVIARSLNLPVPNYAVVDVPKNFPGVVADTEVSALLGNNLGENFGTIYYPGYAVWAPSDTKSPDVLEDLEQLVGFDTVVLNHDRSVSKPNLLVRGESFLLIDHSLALPVVIPQSPFGPTSLMDEGAVRKHCSAIAVQRKGRQFNEPTHAWTQALTASDLTRMRQMIPASWETKAGDLDKIFDFLDKRPLVFPQIVADLRRIFQ